MTVISRHRLPEPFRSILAFLWILPICLLSVTLIVQNGFSLNLFHPLMLLTVTAMALPAIYVWNEGVDVTRTGLNIRVQGWRSRTYDQLVCWTLSTYHETRILKIRDAHQQYVLNCHLAHLTDAAQLLRVLKSKVHYRHWH